MKEADTMTLQINCWWFHT